MRHDLVTDNLPSAHQISKSTSVMIIDDEEDILNLFHDYLQQHGYSVSAFNNPLLALDEIKRKPLEFSIIITDIRMPGISGLELIKTVNKINKNIKVIMMSAFELDDNNLSEITYHEYIQKPVRIPTLLQTVKNLLI
jgi:DNA-binding NtrC family response regulator